ncbi:hypothetical protein OUZ56_002536 [Daphnia magna]|uniref:GMPS ATP-PPase domain-containing protein n=1 Tax=Daphnia magna TaxID=35525 RepID=A0ABR0A608_9CRUS|nr:hypothetical protein OUZ56_002536 [Daphnia magna]
MFKIAESESNVWNLIFKPSKPQLPFYFNKAIKQLYIQGSHWGISLRSGCPTIRPSNLYWPSSSAGNFLCMQLINNALGGTVERKDVSEDGQFKNQVETEWLCPLFKGLETRQMFNDLIENGRKMLHNFLFDICGLQGVFTLQKYEQLTFYDASTNVHVRQTLSFCRTVNPEEKRRIIGDMFVKVVDRTANDLNVTWDNLLLGQVALRPDLIESASHMASSRADAMKTHHNDSEMVLQLRIYGRVVEPLKDFHKDEVRS